MTFVEQSHPAAIALTVFGVAFCAGELRQAFRLRPGVPRAGVLGEVVFRLLFFGAILILAFGASLAPGAVVPGGAAVFGLGAAVGWLGLLLRWWCFVTLGRSFSVVLQVDPGQTIVDRGPYRVVRHPSYTGLLLICCGCGVMLGNWAGALASLTVLLAAVVYRIRIEERALTASLADTYRDFARHRARLLPFLW